MKKFHEWIHRWRLVLLVLVPAAALFLAQGAGKLGFVSDYRVYFSEDNPQLLAFDAMQRTYAKSDNLLIVLSPASGDVFDAGTLEAIDWITDEAWKTPYSLRVDSITNYQRVEAEGDAIAVGDLVPSTEGLDRTALQDIREFALAEPQLVNRLVSSAGDVAAVNVTYQLPEKTPFENAEVVAFGRELAGRIAERHPDIEVRLTGMAMYNNAFFEAAMADGRLIPIMYGILSVMALVMFRSVLATLCVLATVYLATGAASGIAGHLGMSLTSLSASAPLIILTVCVADCVHVAAGVLRMMRAGVERHAAVAATMAESTRPIIITNVMSAAGFLALNTSEMPPFRDLGNIVAIGIGCAMVLTLTLLPVLLSYAPMKPRAGGGGDIVVRAMSALGRRVTSRAGLVAAVLIPLSLVLAGFTVRNEFNDQYMKWFSQANPFRQANDYTMQRLTGLYSIEYSLTGKQGRQVSDVEYLRQLGAYTDWLREQELVVHVSSLSDTFKRINQSLNGGDEKDYRLPEDSAVSAQSLLLYEMSLPYGLDLNNQLNVDKTATRVVVTLRDLTTRDMLDFERKSMAWLKENAPALRAEAASTTLIFAHIGERNIHGLLKGMLGAGLVISLCLVVAFGSLRLGLLSLIPNILPILMVFGVWGIFVGELGFTVAIVAAVSLGIVVDDTVHFMSAVQHARKQGLSVDAAIVDAFEKAGTAMLATTVIIVSGFLVLATSDFALNMHLGLMTAVALIFALATDLLLMPYMIKKVFK